MSLLLFHSRLQVLVAGQTDIWALGKKKPFQVCLMGTMARRAVRRFNRIVFTLGSLGFSLQFRVTRGAEGTQRFRDHPIDIASVGVVAGEAHTLGEWGMVYPACNLLHEISVTLHAQLSIDSLEEVLLAGPMGGVTSIAVRVLDRLMGIGFQEPCFGIRMTLVADRIHSIPEDILEIGSMRIVAGTTVRLGERHMGNLGFQIILGLLVA